MTDTIAIFVFNETVKSQECDRLHRFLVRHQDHPVHIDAHQVRKINGFAVQFLIAAKVLWHQQQQPFEVSRLSDAMTRALDVVGFDPQMPLDEA